MLRRLLALPDNADVDVDGLEVIDAQRMDLAARSERYLLSGGPNFCQLAPTFTEPALRALELALRPAQGLLGPHHAIVVRRRA